MTLRDFTLVQRCVSRSTWRIVLLNKMLQFHYRIEIEFRVGYRLHSIVEVKSTELVYKSTDSSTNMLLFLKDKIMDMLFMSLINEINYTFEHTHSENFSKTSNLIHCHISYL